MVSLCVLVVGMASGAVGVGLSPRSAAAVTAPAPLTSEACAGANGPEIFLLPLFAYMVCLSIIVARCLMGITFEFSFSIPQARAAHSLTIFSLAIPLLTNLVVHTVVMAPFR